MDSHNAKLIELHPAIADDGLDADDAAAQPQLQQLSFRASQILNLQMQGLPKKEIAVRLGMSENQVGHITRSSDYVAARDGLLDREDAALRAMKPMAFKALEEGLCSRDEYTRLMAAALFFRIRGYTHHGEECEAHDPRRVSAEDVAKALLPAQTAVPKISPSPALGRISQSDEEPSRAKPDPSPGHPEGWPVAGGSMRWPRRA
jgi:DNA-binding CsgD family transcriptional regulator